MRNVANFWHRPTLAGVVSAAVVVGVAGTIPSAGPALETASASGPFRTDASHSRAVLSGEWGDDDTGEDEKASALTGYWRADEDLGSLYWVAKHYGAHQAWTQDDPYGRKVTGKDVTVAVIDTGVSPVPGLDTEGKVVNGPDLSFESQAEGTRYLDGYGHGTHMAAIIAGRDSELRASNEHDATLFAGVAPDAQILNMKVAAADGGADVSQVVAAIDWVVQHRRDNGMDVRVINLSYGTRSLQSYELDPLAHAVENAWRAGIVVVVAAGNDGLDVQTLTMPAMDPYVLAVGAVDHRGTGDPQDDVVAAFTNAGNDGRRPDLLAPGKSLVSLRVPGSVADLEHPEGMVTGDADERLFRGSGTSQAAAVVSGAVALILQDRPELTPDQVKAILESTATPLKLNPDPAMGAGVLDIQRAIAVNTPEPSSVRQTWPASTGLGTLEASRGDEHVVDPENGVMLTGEVDALGAPWDARSWSSASAAGAAWSGGDWNARSWSGSDWSARSWSGAAWAARSWSGESWSGSDWQARSWSSDEWNARSWSGIDWLARSWSEAAWVARSWSGDDWATTSSR
jgi:serine protease AprX